MKKFRFAVTAILLVAVVAVVAVVRPVSGQNDIRSEIEAANRVFEAAFSAGDAGRVAACYTAEGQILPPGGKAMTGPTAIAAFWGQAMQAGFAGFKLTTVEVEQHGDTAIEIGTAEIYGPDQSVLDIANYIVIWKRVGGEWKLHRDIWNSSISS